MRLSALQYLACPVCKNDLKLIDSTTDGRQVISGTLVCTKQHRFPITGGIPRFVPTITGLKKQTARSFGYEWQTFDKLLPEYRRNFLQYISPIKPDSFKNKIVLDAGCGMGRHTYYPATYGAKHVFGVDFSDSVEVAYRHCQSLNNVTIIQADILHLPFRNTIDHAYSIGVLHHLPDPQAGFKALVDTVKPGGLVSIWVYGRKNNFSNVYIYETIRRLTRHLPHQLVLLLSFISGLAVHIINQFEKLLGSALGVTNLDNWPFGYYTRFPFVVKYNDAFDVLATPKSNYYRLDQIKSWLVDAKLKKQKVLYLRKKSIKAFGYVPR